MTARPNNAPRVVISNGTFGQTRRKFENFGDLPQVNINLTPGSLFRDDDGNPLNFSIASLPAGLKLVEEAGQYYIRQISPFSEIGDFDGWFTITASDGIASAQTNVRLYVQTTADNGGGDVMSFSAVTTFAEQPVQLSQLRLSDMNLAAQAGTQAYEGEPRPPVVKYAQSKTYWYTYDSNNRVVVDGGSLTGNRITHEQQGSWIVYNELGKQKYLISAGGLSAQQFVYNNQNQLAGVLSLANADANELKETPWLLGRPGRTEDWRRHVSYQYDSVGRIALVSQHSTLLKDFSFSFEDGEVPLGGVSPMGRGVSEIWVQADLRGALVGEQLSHYNADGELIQVEDKSLVESLESMAENYLRGRVTRTEHNQSYQLQDLTDADDLSVKNTTSYSDFNLGGQAAKVQHLVKNNQSGFDTLDFAKTFKVRDSFLELEVRGTGRAQSGEYKPANTLSFYDHNGNKVRVEEQNQLNTSDVSVRKMLYAADGTLLQKLDGKSTTLSVHSVAGGLAQSGSFSQTGQAHHFSSNGQYLGDISKLNGKISSSLRDQHFSTAEQSGLRRYQVMPGDTLRSLALAFYGNGDYWYLIADVNGLTTGPEEVLSAGMTVDVPSRGNTSNTATSFKPMDMAKIIGDTTPDIPYVPPPPRAGCNALAMVVMIAITVVATVAMAGAAAAIGTPAFSMGLGVQAMTGALGWAGAAAAAAGGFVGSVAGQLAGKAMGVVDSFSLKNAFASGLTAGATAGMGSWMGVGSAGTTVNGARTAATPFVEFVGDATKATLNTYGKIAMAASAAGISVAANKLAGNQASFQWRNVVTGAVTAGLMDKAGFSNPNSVFDAFNEGAGVVSGFMDGIAGAAIGYGVSKGLYNEGSWNFRNVATDSFGNAIGNSIVSGLSTKPGELTKQTQSELAQAENSGVVSPELARKVMQETGQSLGGLSVGLDGNKLLVGDGKTDWRGDLSQMDNYHDLSMARNSLISEFGSNMDTDAGRMLNLSFMQLQGMKARELAETPIAQSAAYLQGMAKGETRYNHINRDRIAQQQRYAQTSQQLTELNQQAWNKEQARAKMSTLEKVQLGFDVVGMTEIPGVSQIAELGSAGISLYNGDYVGAGLGVASMIPIAGKWAESAKMQRLTERVKSYSDVVTNSIFKETGARRVLDPSSLDAWDVVEGQYDLIRANTGDVSKIAENIGWSEARVARIKEHVFFKNHQLDSGASRFDADPDMFNAWNRLEQGDFVRADIDLLRHEIFESKFEGIFKTNYRTAHEATIRSGRTWTPE